MHTYVLRDHYIFDVQWVTDSVLSVVWANRAQNLSLITHCAISGRRRSAECREVNLIVN